MGLRPKPPPDPQAVRQFQASFSQACYPQARMTPALSTLTFVVALVFYGGATALFFLGIARREAAKPAANRPLPAGARLGPLLLGVVHDAVDGYSFPYTLAAMMSIGGAALLFAGGPTETAADRAEASWASSQVASATT